MADPRLNSMLKWSIENSDATRNDPTAQTSSTSNFDPEILAQIMGGPSDAQLMVESMDVIDNEDQKLDDRLTAFDNFEQLIENLDNANNMESLKLWPRLASHLDNKEAEIRMYAAWCCAIAVQNNIKSQERVCVPLPFYLKDPANEPQILALGAIPTLIKMATEETDKAAKKKAILALSSIVRNFQPGLDETVSKMPAPYKPEGKLDANDMDSVDSLINKLRESV
jgi:hypothetical protein